MTYEELQDKVNKILTEAETAMENLIETFRKEGSGTNFHKPGMSAKGKL